MRADRTTGPNSGGGSSADVTFFDLELLVDPTGIAMPLDAATERLLLADARRGVLAEPVAGGRDEAAGLLALSGLEGLFEPGLVVVPQAVGARLDDPRAYGVAAALAGAAAGQCRLVSARVDRRAAARRAGWQTTSARPTRSAAVEGAETGAARSRGGAGSFRAGEIDPDTGPVYVLRGRVVTMDPAGQVFDKGQVVVDRGRIAAVLKGSAALPAAYHDATVIDTGGTIYPGLIDLHNHFVYNVLPFWPVKKTWENRTDWARDRGYEAEVSLPIHLLVSSGRMSRAIARYVEAKALMGGTTTGQGMRTQVRGGAKLFRGAMRNVEETNDVRLPEAGTRVPNLGRRPVDFAAFAASLQRRGKDGGAYFYHLAEGTNELALRTYTDLRDHGLLRPALAGIHALALGTPDLARVAQDGAHVVWSPFSNLLLYGRTLDLHALKSSNALFSLGCDWSPTGSKNPLQELKVARFEVARQGSPFTARDLVAAVTSQPARILGWQAQVGAIATGMLADLLVVDGTGGDPYDHLVDAVERDVALVVTHGVARYGRKALVEAATPAGVPVEAWRRDGVEQGFQLRAPESGLDDLTFAAASQALVDAMADLPAFRASLAQDKVLSRAIGVDPDAGFRLVLDNEPEPPEGAQRAPQAADWSHLPASVELDEPWAGGGTYWERLDRQHNISQELRDMLRTAYHATA